MKEVGGNYYKQNYNLNMTRPSTEQLKETLQELVNQHNEAVDVQKNCKERIIAIQAVIQDRGDGNTNDTDSTDSND